MANATLAVVLAVLVLVQVSCGVARHHHDPDPCGGDSFGLLGHKDDHGCSSPAVSAHGTRAVMTVNGFQKGEDGGDPSECDGKYHSDNDLIVALSTGWYAGGKRCHKKIRITSVQNGRTVEATVVDECDSRHGCKNNIVDTSKAVWKKLGLNTDIGEVPVTWSDA
jgi:hypothetical protein